MSFRRRTTETIADLQRQVAALTAAAAPSPATDGFGPPLAPPTPGTSLTDVQDLVRRLAERVDGLDARQLQDHERLSLAFFFNPAYSSVIRPLPATVRTDAPARYRDLGWSEFRRRRADGDFADYGTEVQISDWRIQV